MASEDGRDYDGLIIDLDGVVWLGGEPIEGAVDAIIGLRKGGTRLVFLTNDPSNSPGVQVRRLQAIGITASEAEMVTSGVAMAQFLAGRTDLKGRPAFVIGSPWLKREIVNSGLALVSRYDADNADLVAVGGHPGFDFAELRAAIRAVSNGAPLFAAGRDRTVPTPRGPEPATGAIVAAIEYATDVTATVVSKPEPLIFDTARAALDGCRRVAVIGDNLAADIAGAQRAGLDSILVLSGSSSASDLEASDHQPDLVLPSLAAILESTD